MKKWNKLSVPYTVIHCTVTSNIFYIIINFKGWPTLNITQCNKMSLQCKSQHKPFSKILPFMHKFSWRRHWNIQLETVIEKFQNSLALHQNWYSVDGRQIVNAKYLKIKEKIVYLFSQNNNFYRNWSNSIKATYFNTRVI